MAAETGGMPAAPQLGGIFAGVGMPKLRRTSGAIKTGAEPELSSASDSEASRTFPSKPPSSIAPKPLTAPKLTALRPTPQTATSSTPQTQPSHSLVGNLRKAPPKPAPRPNTDASFRSNSDLPLQAPPPAPTGLKPPPPPISSRKPSTAALPVPTSSASTPSSAPPPPPAAAPRPPITALASPPAPPPPSTSAPHPPSARSTPPAPAPPSSPSSHMLSDIVGQSAAMQAARNAFGNGPSPPIVPTPPPPPPPTTSSPLRPSASAIVPSAPSFTPFSKSTTQIPARALDSTSYTLSNGISPMHSKSSSRGHTSPSRNSVVKIEDSRYHFQEEMQLPKPREFIGGPKKYRAGRGSSVPLALSQFR